MLGAALCVAPYKINPGFLQGSGTHHLTYYISHHEMSQKVVKDLEKARIQKSRSISRKTGQNIQSLEKKWLASEDAFANSQAKRRSLIRIKSGRCNNFDILAAISWLLESHPEEYDDEAIALALEKEVLSPVEVINSNDSMDILLEILTSSKNLLKLEKNSDVIEYWKSCVVLIESRIEEVKQQGTQPAVSDEVEAILSGKTESELEEIEAGAIQTIDSDGSDFWNYLLKRLEVKKASLLLENRYSIAREGLAAMSKGPAIHEKTIPVVAKKDTDEAVSETEDSIETVKLVQLPNARPGKTPVFKAQPRLGFEWNRYNQAHYDSENPPPKAVQGYWFEILYPELEKSSTVPSYRIIRKPEFGEDCVIQFRAPSIYKDICFRIVDKPWDKNARHAGYISKFEDGVLKVNFKFKRQAYRN